MFGGQGGGNPPPYPFQQPPSTTAASEQTATPAPAAGGLFGQATSASGGFGQPSGLFGHSASTFGWGAGSGAASTTGSSPFQQQMPSPAVTTNVLGNAAASAQASSGSSLFGRPVSSFGQPPSTAAPTFGALSATGSGMTSAPSSAGFQPSTLPVFGSAASAPSALFGKPPTQLNQAEAQSSAPAPTASVTAGATAGSTFTDKAGSTIHSLFGKTSDSAAAGAALFGKKTDSGAAGRVSLFGKTDSGAAAGAPLFGKTTDSGAAAGAALFGKTSDSAGAGAGAAAAALFGKTSDSGTTAAGAGLFGKKPGTDTAGGAALFKKTSSGAGLFGKAADFAEDDSGADDIEEFGAPPRSAAAPRASRAGPGPAAGRLKSVFAQPTGTAPAGPRRAISPAEAARRSLARAGLFGKPPESRQMVDKSPVTGPSPAGPRVQRLSSVEELQQVTSLLCTEVPEGYNDKAILTRHFGKFGKVIKVTCSKAKNSASVHFADHASADAAKKRGARVHPKLPAMNLFFRRPVKSAPPPPQAPTSSSADDASDDQRPAPGASETREPRRLPPVATAAAPPAPPAAPPAAALNVSELRAALRQPAASASERFRVLDARDKLHRAALRREGPARSGPLVGTCADMCPEKERYMREEKHQISGQYERDRDRQGGFEMDHRLAVKQYSRSSADQEEPLPHELRTPAALLRTMDYLVTHVTDSESRDTGDWFHFIWDRTRGIRKDITQQQLTDVVSVGLVEKCARFHVHCAASLCELSRDMFDQKINNENLTKCLQTLKHMYHDLSLKGVRCEREAEFRAYDILLNLNQGDILREAQTYSDEVRDSPEVQSALRLYGALSTNNYVRFFTLVRRADYLSSCLLQRYFNQVRTRALDVITRAFCPAKQVVEFPLSQLQRMLGFESEQECASVLRQHGLESEEGTAFLERAQFLPPDTPPELRRCPTLIDAKLGGWSVGQAVQGGLLPADPLPEYRPHDSFDAHGVLRRSAWDVQDQTTGGEGVGATTAATLAPPPPVPERAVSPDRDTAELVAHRVAMSAAGQILTEVVTEETRRQSEQLLAAAAAARHICARIHQDTMDQVVAEMVRSVCQTELAEARRLAQEQRRFQEQQRREAEERRARELQMQERARQDQIMKDRLASVLTETLVAEVCLDETADIAEQEMQTVQAQHSVLAEVHARLWTEGADQLARQTAESVLAECRRQRDTLVRALQEIGRRMTLRRLVGRWRRVTEDGRRLRADQWLFPAGLPLHDAATTLQLLGGPRAPPHPPADPWADGSLCSLLLHDRLSTQPVSVPAVLSRAAAAAAAGATAGAGGAAVSGGRRLWKLAVPAPAGCPLTQWLLHKLTDPDPPQQLPDGVLQLGTAPLPSGGGRLSVCVRRLEGRPAESVGTAGLLLAFSGAASAADRLNQLLAELPREPLVPLAVLAADDAQQSALAHLRLPERLRAGAVTTYRLFELHPEDGVQSGRALVSALEWLYAHTPPPPPLRAARLRHLAQDFLGRQVTRRLYSDMQTRRSRRRVEQSPVAGLALYNAAVRHLSVVLSSGSLPDLSWPPAELMESSGESESESQESALSALPPPGWNGPERLLRLQQAVCELSLPPLDVDPDWSWSECCAKVLQYVTRLSGGDGDGAPALYRVRSLLRDRLQLLRRAAWPLDDDVGDQPLSASLPWTDIVQSCIELRVEGISCANEQAFFLPDELDNFRVPDVWTEYTSVGHTEESLTLDESVTLAKRSLDTSAAEDTTSPAGKRRPDRSSLGRPTLDVSADISREMNVSLDWEQRLRELVDQGDASGAAAAPLPPPARTTPPRAGRRASLEHQLQLLRAQLAEDRRSAQRLERQLQLAAAAGLSPPPPLQGGPRG